MKILEIITLGAVASLSAAALAQPHTQPHIQESITLPDPNPEVMSIRFEPNAAGKQLGWELFNEARSLGECVVMDTTPTNDLWLRSCTQAEIKKGYR